MPFDTDTVVASAKKTNRIVIVHEAVKNGGIGGEISAQIQEQAFDYLDAPIEIVAGKNTPIPYNVELERAAVPQEQDIDAAVRRSLNLA